MSKARGKERGASAMALLAVLVLALAAGAAGYWLGVQRAPGSAVLTNPSGGTPAPVDEGGRKILYWHDPMVPGQKFDRPGKSPFMDMDLVPVYADSGADEGRVTVSPRLVQSLGIRTAEARTATLDGGFTAVGAVTVDERGIVAVQVRAPGFVEHSLVRATQEYVEGAAPLVEVFVPEWVAAEEEYVALLASSGAHPAALNLAHGAKMRLQQLGVPNAELNRIERERSVSPRVTIPSPMGGIVWEIGVRDGMAFTPGTTLFKIADIQSVWVLAEIPESQAALATVGANVEVRVAAFPGKVYRSKLEALLPEVTATTRTLRARIVLKNPDRMLKPGMFATVTFGGANAPPVVVVPAEAVMRTGKRDVVIVAEGEGRFAPVEVEVGRESGDLTEIRKGVTAGQKVVVGGQFLVDSEANLKGALGRLTSEGDVAPVAEVHKGEGVVRAVGAEILIKHGAIPTAGMGAMTMAFKAPKGGTPKGVDEGTNVRFEFVLTPQGEMQLTSIVPTTAVRGTPAAPKPESKGIPSTDAAGPAVPASGGAMPAVPGMTQPPVPAGPAPAAPTRMSPPTGPMQGHSH